VLRDCDGAKRSGGVYVEIMLGSGETDIHPLVKSRFEELQVVCVDLLGSRVWDHFQSCRTVFCILLSLALPLLPSKTTPNNIVVVDSDQPFPCNVAFPSMVVKFVAGEEPTTR